MQKEMMNIENLFSLLLSLLLFFCCYFSFADTRDPFALLSCDFNRFVLVKLTIYFFLVHFNNRYFPIFVMRNVNRNGSKYYIVTYALVSRFLTPPLLKISVYYSLLCIYISILGVCLITTIWIRKLVEFVICSKHYH